MSAFFQSKKLAEDDILLSFSSGIYLDFSGLNTFFWVVSDSFGFESRENSLFPLRCGS